MEKLREDLRIEMDEAHTSRSEIQRSLGRIEGQLNSLVSSFVQHLVEDASNFKELKLHMSSMQKKLWTFGGAFIAIGFLLSHSDKVAALIK